MEVGRAIQQVAFSGGQQPDEALQLVLRPIPVPSPGHVLVRMLISVINPVDITFIKECRLSSFKGAVPGSEGVGIVHQVGEGITTVRRGERVIPVIYWNYLVAKGQGAWQDFVEVAETDLIILSENIPDEAASLFIISPWTVYGLLQDLAIPRGEFLLQTAGGSVIGRLVIQLAKHWGIKTISLIRREELREELLELGADEVINSSKEDVIAKVLEITKGRGAYAGIDVIAGVSTKVVAASVRDYGDIYVYGMISSPDVVVAAHDLMRKVNVTFWNLTRFLKNKEKKQDLLTALPKLFESKVLTPLVRKKIQFNQYKLGIHESVLSAGESMANMMEKIGDKLHMGGHKKEEPHTVGAAHPPQYAAPGYGVGAAAPGYSAATPGYGAPTTATPHQEGAMGKIKNKVKGSKNKVKVHGEDTSSSSSSESDGAGGRRKKKMGIF
ncbi:hypothetical protein GOP47_0002095 [Adiantum capillus-veneris]|uniref:Enoyl reductase (ER) domain-containing protein n=1 Tax=Adiantum capillus-veneris TaxID=13818 RepID=A0A9D4VA26_ADICA|nr:hypothetical protein GOP47_0002095 [Adiantum capillus-veneris]